jgi:hypothetical protein
VCGSTSLVLGPIVLYTVVLERSTIVLVEPSFEFCLLASYVQYVDCSDLYLYWTLLVEDRSTKR